MALLGQDARAAQHAPSVFNTQPWSWRISGDTMDLFAALHHARVALAAAGRATTVEWLPDPDRPELLARISLARPVPPGPEAVRMAAAIARRRTDRRAFGDRPVPEAELTKLRRFVEAEGAYLHVVRPDQIAMLVVATERAARSEFDDPAYRAHLRRWTDRSSFPGDGVPPATAVRPELRRVPGARLRARLHCRARCRRRARPGRRVRDPVRRRRPTGRPARRWRCPVGLAVARPRPTVWPPCR